MTPRDPQASRAALLRAASEAFAARGFAGARTQAIADAAGVNKAMILHHFGSKQDLYSAVILDHIVRAQEAIAGSLADRDASPPEQLDRFLQAFGRCIGEQPDFVRIIMREQMDGAPRLEGAVRDRFFGFFGTVRTIIEEGIAHGHFRPLDAHATHLSLVGSLVMYRLTEPARETYLRAGAAPGPIPSWNEYVDHIRDLFARGLRPDDETDRTHSEDTPPSPERPPSPEGEAR
jgi:TetR/AcrR family transcriptional regulator